MDAIKRELFSHRILSILEDMESTLKRMSFSKSVKEGSSLFCGIFNKDAKLIACSSPNPIYVSSGSFIIKSILEQLIDSNKDDVYITNDPFKGSINLSSIAIISPVFFAKNLNFFIVNIVSDPNYNNKRKELNISKSIIQEGILIEPMKLIKEGKFNKEFVDHLFYKNLDYKQVKGNLNAQLSANYNGIKNLKNLIKIYGLKTINETTNSLIQHSDKMMQETIKNIPNGNYSFNGFLDNDGINKDDRIKISVKITIKDNSAIIDLSSSENIVRGPMNITKAITYAAVFYVFRALSKEKIPINHGVLLPIKIITKKHSVLDASYPASVSHISIDTAQRLVDSLLGALAQAIPKKIPADSQGTLNNLSISGFYKDKKFYFQEILPGGAGAAFQYEGEDAIQTHLMSTLSDSIEYVEKKYPFIIEEYKIRKNSGGKGVFNGGNGILKKYKFLQNVEILIIGDRNLTAPYSPFKLSAQGKKSEYSKVDTNGNIKILPGKCKINMKKGEKLIIKTPGAGAWGKK